jgi:hypothetical protein
MSDPSNLSPSALQGLKTIVLENEWFRVTVMPEAGAKIYQVHYKPLQAHLLWNNLGVAPAKNELFASYDDNWSGGWDELFPNDEAGEVLGRNLPDHGELWTGAWDAEPFETADVTGVRLRYTTPITHFEARKEIVLPKGAHGLEVCYGLTNRGSEAMPFLWKLHPAFAVSVNHRIDFPVMTVVREAEFAGTLEGAPAEFAWPWANFADRRIDLRQVPDVSSRAIHFFYGVGLRDGWCGITDRAKKLAAGLRFDASVFTSCWLFATHGGWRDLNVAVLEPATGYPFQMKTMMERGQARMLAPGESLETKVLLSVREGLTSIGGVREDGTILPGDEA